MGGRGPIPLGNLTTVPKMVPLNIKVMRNIGLVKLQGNQYVLVRRVEKKPAEAQPTNIPMGQPEPLA